MCRVGCSGLTYPKPDFQIVFIDYPAEAIPAYWIVASKLCFVHMPEFRTAYARIKFAYVFDVL